MKKIQLEAITGAVAILAGVVTYFAGGGDITNAILGGFGAGFITMIVVAIYNAFAR